MSDTLALLKLYDDVEARFAAEGTDVTMRFGWRVASEKVPGHATITWTPGDPGGALGEVTAPRNPGRNPRPIGTLGELCYVQISARDNTDPESERAQYQKTRELFDAWYRAVYLAAHGTFEVQSSEWMTTQNLRRSGAAILCVVSVQAMIPDTALGTVTDASAVVDVSQLSLTEEVTT